MKEKLSLTARLHAVEEKLAAGLPAKRRLKRLVVTANAAVGLKLSPQDDDLHELRFWVSRDGYAMYSMSIKGHLYAVQVHQLVANRMGLYPCAQVDHINGIPLDCQRENLRAATQSDNQRNLHKPTLIGVGSTGARWFARIYNGKRSEKICIVHSGYPTKERAAFAYNQLAQLFGYRTRNNVPIPLE